MVQKLHLLGRRLDALAVDDELKGIQVDDQLVKDQPARLDLLLFPARAAEDRLDSGQQLLHLEGLRQIIVGALLQALHLVVRLALGGEHDDGGLAVLPDGAQHAPAVHHGQHDIEQHQVRPHLPEQGHALAAVGGDLCMIAFLFQIHLDQLRDIGVVFHDEDRFCHKTLSLLCHLNYYTAVVGICVNIL